MYKILFFSMILSEPSAWSQMVSTTAPTLEWQVTSGPALANKRSIGDGVAIDSQGNIYQSVITSDFSNSICPLAFINKFDSAGNPAGGLWPVNFDSCGRAFKIAIDANGFVYAAGFHYNPTFTSSQMILAKFDPTGRLLWRQVFTASGGDGGVGLGLDSVHGLVYVLDEACIIPTATITSQNACWLRYDSNGNLLAKQLVAFLDNLDEFGLGLTADANSVTTLTTPFGPDSARVARWNLDGSLAWANLGPVGFSSDAPEDIAEDSKGDVLLAQLGPVDPLYPNSLFNAVLYNPQGQIVFKVTDPAANSNSVGAAADAQGNFYISGVLLTSAPGSLVDKFDSSGHLLWRLNASGNSDPMGVLRLAVDRQDNVYLSGHVFVSTPVPTILAVLAKYGQSSVMTTLKISLNSPNVFPSGTGSNSQTQVIVQAIDNAGNGVPNQSIKIDAFPPIFGVSPEDQLGGHDHDDNRPIGVFTGGTCAAMNGATCVQVEITCTTDSNGNCIVSGAIPVYTASIFGGKERIVASLANNPTVSTSTLLDVSVADEAGDPLGLLPDNPLIYTKTGGIQVHHGPPTSLVDNNHYGTAEFNSIISSVSIQFKTQFPGRTVLINDMSLPFGGLFDIGPTGACLSDGIACSFWNSPHTFHRLGTSCDYNLDIGLTTNSATPEARLLKRIISNTPGLKRFPEVDHWHLYFTGGGP